MRKTFPAFLCCFIASAPVFGAAMPSNVVAQLSAKLPAAMAPIASSGFEKINPLRSEKSNSPDRTTIVPADGTPCSLSAVSADGSKVELSVKSVQGGEWTKRWFKCDDVFGKIKWKLEPYRPEVDCLAYFPRGKNAPELVGRVEKETLCASLGSVVSGKTSFRVALVRKEHEAGGAANPFMIVMLRENPPAKTRREYDARAKQMMDEYAFREGRPWGKMFPSILGNKGCFECAGMAADAATYMLGAGLKTGEEYTKPEEIRAGDTVNFKTHWIYVVDRKGTKLTTIEGNMNESVSKSTKRYSVVGGKFMVDGAEREFIAGYHNWTPAK